MIVLYLREVSLVKYISVQKYSDGVREPFYEKVACLHDVIFISQHFDWVLNIISECDWMNYFYCRDFIIVKKKCNGKNCD